MTISGLLASFLLYMFADPLATLGFKEPEAAYFIQAGALLILVNVIEPISLFYFRVFRQIKKFSYLTLFEALGKLLFILVLLKMGYGLLRNGENIISIFLSPILSLMVIWGNGIIEPFPK